MWKADRALQQLEKAYGSSLESRYDSEQFRSLYDTIMSRKSILSLDREIQYDDRILIPKLIALALHSEDIEELSLKNNAIGPEGGQALVDALRVNTSLRKLDAQDNQLGDTVKEALEDLAAMREFELNL